MILNKNHINSLLSTDCFALIGAGQLGEMAIDQWPKSLPLPEFFLDSNRIGLCRGIPIYNFDDYCADKSHFTDKSPIFLLSAFKLPSSTIIQFFECLSQDTILTVYDLFECYCSDIFSNGWFRANIDDHYLEYILTARNCFGDQRSLDVFDAAIAWRYRRELIPEFSCEPEETKYKLTNFGRDVGFYDFVVDCGSYDLSFAKNLEVAKVTVGSYIAFEPDDLNFNNCLKNMFILESISPEVIIIERKAVYDNNEIMQFFNVGLLSSRLSKVDGDIAYVKHKQVNTINLDSYMKNWLNKEKKSKGLLKLHIEGAELAALRGAHRLISKCEPDIFINLSHDESSLLEIPLHLKLKYGYNLKLVGHCLFGEGLTLVASK